jgi:hypothetical protein
MKTMAMRGTTKNGEEMFTIGTPYKKGSRETEVEEWGVRAGAKRHLGIPPIPR